MPAYVAGEVGAVAALLAGWAGLAGADVVPDAAGLAGLPARARPSAVPPAASRKARVSTTGSRAVRRRPGLGPVGPGAVGPGAALIDPVVDIGQDSPAPDFGRSHATLPMPPLPRPYAADSE